MEKRMFLLIAACLLFSSCSSYYYSFLNSNDENGAKNEDGDFVTENDSVRISFSFYGKDAPVFISIYNKMNEPLFVDWQRSALIIDDNATSFYQETVPVQGVTESYSTYGYSDGGFSGEVTISKGISFIPPRSKVESNTLKLSNLPFENIPKEDFTKQKFAKSNTDVVNVYRITYDEENTPLRFRIYLTLYTLSENGKEEKRFSCDRSFYVSELIKTGNVPPTSFQAGKKQAGDFFYVHKVKRANAGIIVGAVAIGAAGIVIESTLTPSSY